MLFLIVTKPLHNRAKMYNKLVNNLYLIHYPLTFRLQEPLSNGQKT